MLDHLLSPGAETPGSAQGSREATDNHVNLSSIHILCFTKSTAGSTKNSIRPRFVEDQSELVLVFEFNLGTSSVFERDIGRV